MSDTEGALFEALNAKKLSPQEIAASFVIPAQYDQLVGLDHSYLVGPRGSGKTTLLRMLEGQALMAWDHRRAAEYRRRVGYSAVFLPADRLWATQVQSSPEVSEALGVAAFGTQMLYALVETMLYRIGEYSSTVHHPADLPHRSEVELVYECAAAWELELRTPSLVALQGALDLRLNRIANSIDRLVAGATPENFVGEPAIAPVEALRFGIRAFNRHAREPHHRWALLLDEMELAPRRVHQALTDAIRGGEKVLTLKLSFSPFDRFASPRSEVGGASPEHDFRPIYLWYGTRVGGRKFTSGLWRRMMTETVGRYRPAVRVLGQSEIDVSGATWADSAYETGSKQFKLIQKMAQEDPTFREFLDRRKIDLADIQSLSYERKSATLRKVYPLLVFRDAVLEFEDGVAQRRPRKKTTECFTGSDAVFAALEGNPRWIKAVFSTLLSAYEPTAPSDRSRSKPSGRVERGLQYDTLRDAAERFESLLRVLPADGEDASDFSVLELLDTIAKYFSTRAFGPFTADPPSTFVVDKRVPQSIHSLLKTALSAGAVVHLRGKESPPVLPDLGGERFRLAYLLTIRDGYEVPFRLGKTTNLSSILTWARTEAIANPTAYPSLFTALDELWEED